MHDRDTILSGILHSGIVAVVRSPDPGPLVQAARALLDGGISAIEITFTVPRAPEVIAEVRKSLGERIILGAGTVLDSETARAALLAGADFLVAPIVSKPVIRLARRYGKVVIPGAFTPTEVLAAWELGADIVKIFPAEIGGPPHLRALAGPLPQVRLMPTGGVDLNTAEAFLRAGACCLGVGSALVDPLLLKAHAYEALTDRARSYREVLENHRSSVDPS
jgi:2-dehydro-3-deoxyphosphogluconate aldolase/(4S)-4-hydroxy-2-oxoglutarate aldolase